MDKEFVRLVEKLRKEQNNYFKTKDHKHLIESKRLEKLVDDQIKEYLNIQLTLNL